MEEDLLEYVGHFSGSMIDCTSEVRTRLADDSSEIRNVLSKNRVNRPFTECVMKDVEEDDDRSYENAVLRELAVTAVSPWRFWTYFTKESRLKELKNEKQKFIDRSLLKCKGHREFYDLFNKLIDKELKWHRSGEQEYCIRKHLVNTTLINNIKYDFRENPRNVKTETLICKDIVSKMHDEIYNWIKNKPTQPVSECALKIYKEQNYADQILKVEVYSKLNLEVTDKSRERQDFTNALIAISYDVANC